MILSDKRILEEIENGTIKLLLTTGNVLEVTAMMCIWENGLGHL
jgi:hypothetical protein